MRLQERKLIEQERENKIQNALYSRKKELEEEKKQKKGRRRTAKELLVFLDIEDIKEFIIRPIEDYVPRSYNLDRQIIGLLSHLFVKYPVPYFLMQSCFDPSYRYYSPYVKTNKKHTISYQEWFVTCAQGGKFNKLVKPYMTSKEASIFLNGINEYTPDQNIWYARLKVHNIPSWMITSLINRLFTGFEATDNSERFSEAISFYANNHRNLNGSVFGETLDFLVWKFRNDSTFRMKGRTINSIIKLSNEWHDLMQRAKLGKHIEWEPLYKPWKKVEEKSVWEIIELCTNKDLMNEGRKQKHCVYGYVHRCSQGQSHIFSLRQYEKNKSTSDEFIIVSNNISFPELSRTTFEVVNRSIVQCKGPSNVTPGEKEIHAIKDWAGTKGIACRNKY